MVRLGQIPAVSRSLFCFFFFLSPPDIRPILHLAPVAFFRLGRADLVTEMGLDNCGQLEHTQEDFIGSVVP